MIRRFLSSQIVVVTLIGSVLMAIVCAFGSIAIQIAVLGGYISILGGLALEIFEDQNTKDQQLESLELLIRASRRLAKDSPMSREFEKIVDGIQASSNIESELFRELAIEELARIGQQTELLGRGIITFDETEAWRVAYERILRSPLVSRYFSVSLIRSADYWQDEPGKRSIELNYQLQDEKRLNVERIAIISASIWPDESDRPNSPIFEWLLDQYSNGIWTELVRETSVIDEPDLLVDSGRYSDLAVGCQFLDSKSRTSKFTLSFNKADIEAAKQRWQRLSLYSISMKQILDQT